MISNMMKKTDPSWRDLKLGTLNANLNPALENAPLHIFCPQASELNILDTHKTNPYFSQANVTPLPPRQILRTDQPQTRPRDRAPAHLLPPGQPTPRLPREMLPLLTPRLARENFTTLNPYLSHAKISPHNPYFSPAPVTPPPTPFSP